MTRQKPEDVEAYRELRAQLREDERLLFDAVALGVFTEAYRSLRREIHQQTGAVTEADAEQFATRVMAIESQLIDYQRLLMDINQSLQQPIQRAIDIDNADVLDNAFSNFLRANPSFTYRQLMDYFEERYSEKRLIKYIGHIPIYKKTLVFERREIDARLESLIAGGVVLNIGAQDPKQRKKEGLPKLDKCSFISMPLIYAVFAGSWNPLAVYPEAEQMHIQVSKVMRDLMSMDLETSHAAKMLKLLFKEQGPAGLLQNLAGIVVMYSEQMGEHRPDFIVDGPEGPTIAVPGAAHDYVETVRV
ncbi:MAG: hypothetical protein N3H30_01555 [Candidatus Micrarchaeota archaeon]|nr:hypothetical protein [Candidatus Micrarchaeota archaeon]